ncbi:MAG: acyl carrier protein [Faecousia sp.]
MLEKIIKLICDQLGLDEDRVTAESTFEEDLCCDSLDVIELMATAEEEFGMGSVPEEKLAEIKTVGDLVRYVESVAEV